MEINVVSKTNCPYCTMAKNWLKQNNIEYTEQVLDNDDERMSFYQQYNNVKSVPQIFVDGIRIGGYNDLISRKDEILAKTKITFNSDF